ncbi:GntR family transcriptional regulator [Amycolatopsis sp. NPDC059027]|uniref:GntR family transcriptional regulator n=1 Tax=Amycolatopsis sp. NPDC059027 TaxID=3346709 RepID=UPI00366F184E
MPERVPLSRQIAADLGDLIRTGKLAPGALMPSERELIERYGTSKSTASKAIALLRAEGLVTTEFGRGTFVRSRPPLRRVSAARRHAEHRSSGKPIFDTEAIEQGQVPSRQMLLIGRAQVPPDAAEWLQATTDEEVVIRKRLQLLNGNPAVISTSYYPLWLAANTRLESPEPLPEGPDELIEALGHRFSRGVEVFRVRMPTAEEAELLHLSSGTPIVQMWDVDYDNEGRTLQVAEDLYAGDRHEFIYEWSEGDIKT